MPPDSGADTLVQYFKVENLGKIAWHYYVPCPRHENVNIVYKNISKYWSRVSLLLQIPIACVNKNYS